MADSLQITNLLFPSWNPNDDDDPLLSTRYSTCIENFPPTAVDASSGRQNGLTQAQTGTEYGLSDELKEILKETTAIIYSQSRDEFAAWIHKCHSSKVNLDIDRISRFFLFHGNIPVVEYLVTAHRADLKRRDTYGRSAIFYLPRNWVHGMFTFLSPHLREKASLKDLNHPDSTSSRRTPLHYALIDRKCIHKIEYLLANDADIDIQDRAGKTPKALIFEKSSYVQATHQTLYGFSQLLREPDPPYFVTTFMDYDLHHTIRSSLQTLKVLQDDLKASWHPRNTKRPKWIHIPFTNGMIIYVAIRRLAREFDLRCNPYMHLLDDDWFALLFLESFREPSYKSNYTDIKHSDVTISLQTSIRLPYLRLQTRRGREQLLKKTQGFRKIFIGQEQPQPRTQHPFDGTLFNFTTNAIYAEHTLDEAYYPGLPATTISSRNEDQVVYREWIEMQKRNRDIPEKALGPVSTVPQLWLWRFGDHLVTACPDEDVRYNNSDFMKCPTWIISLQDLASRFLLPVSTGIRIGMIIADHISQFDKPQADGQFPSPLDLFETGIVRILSDVEQYTNPKSSLPPDVQKERDFMHSIADIREESAMILAVLDEQQEIAEKINHDFTEFEFHDLLHQILDDEEHKRERGNLERGRMKMRDSLLEIERQRKRVNKIDRDAERIEKVIQDQLNLKRTYATIRDTRNGLILSAAVIGFTITTIFFAPIAFMTSLFALPLDVLIRNQIQFNPSNGADPTPAYTSTYVGTWFAVAEVVSLVVTALLVALCLWLFGDIENFSVLQQLRLKKPATRSSTTDEDRLDEKDETTSAKGKDNPGKETRSNNIRKRAARLFKFGGESNGLEENLVSGALA